MRQRMRRAWLLALLAAAPPGAGAAPADALVFVVPARSSVRTLPAADLRKIYLGEITRWSNHRRIVLAVGPSATRSAGVFYDRVVGMSEIDFSQRWLGIVFRGESPAPPRVAASREAVSRFLSQNPDGLAYLLGSELDFRNSAIRPLTLDGARPEEPDYPFRIP